jgi:hypothetical protein
MDGGGRFTFRSFQMAIQVLSKDEVSVVSGGAGAPPLLGGLLGIVEAIGNGPIGKLVGGILGAVLKLI